MKKFLVKLIVFVLIISAPVFIISIMYNNTNYSLVSCELYNIKYYPKDIELLNLGNSHAKAAYRYKDKYNGVTHNFATSSQPFYYDYQVLKSVSGSLKKNAVVIIPVSLFDWYYNVPELFTQDQYNYNKRYYKVLNPSQMYNFKIDDYIKYGLLSGLTAKKDLKYIKDDIQKPIQDPVNLTVENNISKAAIYKEQSWKGNVIKIDEKTKNFNVKYFNKIIEYCYEKGYTPVVITMPIPDTLSSKFSEDYHNDFNQILNDQLNKYPDIIFIDYAKETLFTKDHSLYRDSDHMNSTGGDKFTYKLLNDLVERSVIDKSKIINK